jgi:hypothetical protein
MDIERYVGSKWSENVTKANEWDLHTKNAESCIEKALHHANDTIVTKNSSTTFLVQVKRITEVPLIFAVDLNQREEMCTCQYDKDMGAPLD